MAEVIKEIKYESLKNFIDDISYNGELYKIFERNYIFRGLSSDKYNLIPNALREEEQESLWKLSGCSGALLNYEFEQIMIEFMLLQRFFNKCDYNGLSIPNVNRLRADMIINIGVDALLRTDTCTNPGTWIPDDLFEIAGIAQHYGIPTRLLDWTQDIFVALYFAASGALKIKGNHQKESKYMVIWALNSTLVDTFKYKKPLKIIIPQYNSNPNLCAQKGLFTLWQVKIPIKKYFIIDTNVLINRTPLDTLISNETEFKEIYGVLYKILIPKSEAKNLYDYLRHLGYDASRLFPGYSGIRQCIEEDSLFFDCKTVPYPPLKGENE